MKKVNIGIIGCGHWGPNFVRNFSRLPNASVVGVCDMDKKRLKHVKQFCPSAEFHTNYKRILNNKDIDAVVVSTPAATHHKLIKEALLLKKHVLAEKPIALDLSGAEELVNLAKKEKRILMIGHTFLYNSAIRKMREIVKKKTLGRVYYLHSKRTNLGPLRKDVGATGDLASHDISIFLYLLGSLPVKVMARGQDYLQKGKEDVAFITLMYPKKIIANIHVSWLDPRKVREITIVGSKKMVVFDDLDLKEPIKLYDKRVMKKKYKHDYDSFPEFQMIIQDDGQVSSPRFRKDEPLKVECKHFLECVQKKNNPLTDGINGLDVLRVLLAVGESINKKGKPVRLRKK